jgi:thiol-disulfide isomerase/thioredoxin
LNEKLSVLGSFSYFCSLKKVKKMLIVNRMVRFLRLYVYLQLQIMMKMKAILFFLTAMTLSAGFAQKIKIKVADQPDTTVHLVKYAGAKLYYADTAQIKKGVVEFDGAKQQAGLMGLLLPGQRLVEFMFNKEEVDIETKGPDFMANMKVKKSEENKVFNAYVSFITKKRTEVQALNNQLSSLKKEDAAYKDTEAKIKAINNEVLAHQKEIAKNHANMLVGKMINMSIEVDIPEAPVDKNGAIIDSNFKYHYYRDHFFDNTDFSVDGLVNTPIFGTKIEYYFSNKMLMQHWDTILKYAYDLIDNRLDPKSRAFEYVVSHVTSTYGKSNQMGMDKVYALMADKYYCSKNKEGKSPAFWMTADKLDELCEKINVQKHLVMGELVPNIILPDTLDKAWDQLNWVSVRKLPSEYTVLYFWDADCGHCKKVTPKLAELYDKKLKARNIEVVAIGKATDGNYKKWKEYIVKNKLNFINLAVTETVMNVAKEKAHLLVPRFTNLESLNVHNTFDIYSTPRIFLLDKNKRFIAKQISVSQLEEILDREQGMPNAPKLFPPDPEEDEHMQSKD